MYVWMYTCVSIMYVCGCIYTYIRTHVIVGRYTQKVELLLSLFELQVIFPLQTFVNILNFYGVHLLVSGGEEHEGLKNHVI